MTRYEIQWEKLKPRLPDVKIVEKERVHPNAPDEAVAVYEHRLNRITIKASEDNWGIRAHEYGHWLFASTFDFIDEAWEVAWWHFGIRKIFIKRQSTKAKEAGK